ncbi:MAG: OmpA family protein, partial [Pseudomonadota bacterium]|nr:OmpA family protein [Pseudomonadota bacterium]
KKPKLYKKKFNYNKNAKPQNIFNVDNKAAKRDDKIKKRRVISRPASSKGQRELAILFESETLTLALGENERLNKITSQLIDKPNQGIQLISYASTRSKNASAARRLSLQRALKIRNKLIKNGVSATKMSVRALGDRVKSGSPDRVDIIMTK